MTQTVKTAALMTVIGLSQLAYCHDALKPAGGPYPKMAPISEYLIADRNAEIALSRSAAPASISDAAEVRVLGQDGYTTAVQGTNGFVCMVERSWGKPTDDEEFWSPKVRAPHCFNAAAARTFLPIYLMKTGLVLTGKSPAQIADAMASAMKDGRLPPVDPGAMCYMMSKEQILGGDSHWHPHLMFFVAGSTAKSWGANLPQSPIIAADDPEEHVTVFMVWVSKWSDGTPFEH